MGDARLEEARGMNQVYILRAVLGAPKPAELAGGCGAGSPRQHTLLLWAPENVLALPGKLCDE